jgi:ubiquinone/menaquinone biosynthesis C-methylase UbiE
MSIYREYAGVYDRSGQMSFSLRMVPYLRRLLCRHPVEGDTLLELACGTGTVAVAMAEAAYRVYGVDASEEMLQQARAKAAEVGVEMTLSQQDMRSFVIPERVHLASCLYDSINYMLTSEDLSAVFGRVYRTLLPGGLFLFDMNTAYALCTLWDDEVHLIDGPDITVIIKSHYDERRQRVTAVVTVFERVGEMYRKIQEEHTEQAYPEEQVATLLADVGFRVEAYYECFAFEAPGEETPRIMWVARRPQ